MHLNRPEINLETHIQDVVNLILFEDLHDVVLTGHSYGGMVVTGVMDRVPERMRHVVWPADPSRFADGFMQVPWVKAGTPPPPNVKQSTKCFSQPVSYKNPAALKLPVSYVAFVPKDKSAAERAQTDKSWPRAVARGWTIRTFPGGHVAQHPVNDVRGRPVERDDLNRVAELPLQRRFEGELGGASSSRDCRGAGSTSFRLACASRSFPWPASGRPRRSASSCRR